MVAGPNDDWIDAAGQERFLTSDWKLSSKSDRTGFRLDGPQWTFTAKAYNKPPENGSEPSNIIDHGYPLGAINLAGQTPIILVNDGPSMGGFINPYTVPSAAFWKLGQSKPGDIYRFKAVTVDEAQALRRAQDALCGPAASSEPSHRPLRIKETDMAERVETQVPGNVWKVLVKQGDKVKAGDTLFIMEVMKTEVPHMAESGGTVIDVRVSEGEEGLEAGILAVVID